MKIKSQWKMIHTLNTCTNGKLSYEDLRKLGIDCYDDTISILKDEKITLQKGKYYSLNPVTRRLINRFTLSDGYSQAPNIYIDLPSCFVIMPFSAPWSANVYKKLIESTVVDCNLTCKRGDTIPRDKSLVDNLVSAIFVHGLSIIDISGFNPNVLYELGLVQSTGKEYRILLQSSMKKKIPADLQHIHYIEYDLKNLKKGKERLKSELTGWKKQAFVMNTMKYVSKSI